MPTAVYPFTRFVYLDGQKDLRACARLPLRITNPHTAQNLVTWGLVDTGADLTVLPGELAVRLGHKLKAKGVKRSVTTGIEQTNVFAYAHTFEVELLSTDLTRVVWAKGRHEFDCVASNPPLFVGLEDFLKHFRLLVNYPAKSLRLSRCAASTSGSTAATTFSHGRTCGIGSIASARYSSHLPPTSTRLVLPPKRLPAPLKSQRLR